MLDILFLDYLQIVFADLHSEIDHQLDSVTFQALMHNGVYTVCV